MKLCECGCGAPTPVARQTRAMLGHTKGQPTRFCKGHNGIARLPIGERFDQYVYSDPNSGCALWCGACNDKGYGRFSTGGHGGRLVYAHHFAWERAGNPSIPSLRHKCDTPCCVNPDHLIPGPQKANLTDMARRDRGRRGKLPRGVMRSGSRYAVLVGPHDSRVYVGKIDTVAEAKNIARELRRKIYGGVQ